jgi:hypothetical protein
MNCGCRRDETSADDHYDVIKESYKAGYQAGQERLHTAETEKELDISEARRLRNYDVYMRGYREGRKSLIPVLEHIIEYWNGGSESAVDAIEHVIDEAEEALMEIGQ